MNKKTSVILFLGAAFIATAVWWYARDASVVVLTSDDGNVTLSIPKGALPEGVRAADINITNLGYDAVVQKPSTQDFLAAYEFQPDGLAFTMPVSVSFALKNFDGLSVPAVDIASKEELTALVNQRITIDEQKKIASITGEMTHFSQAILHKGFFTAEVNGPADHFVGETFTVEAIHAVARRTYVSLDNEFVTRTLTLVGNPTVYGKITAWVHAVPELAYPDISEAVSPRWVDSFPVVGSVIGESGELKTVGTFTCVKPGAIEFRYESTIIHEYEFQQTGKPYYKERGIDFPDYENVLSKGRSHEPVGFILAPFRCLDRATPLSPPALQVGQPVRGMVQVISYGGKNIPVTQLIIENETGCGEPHYHAANGFVTATDGTKLYDPGPPCGYGKVSERPTSSIAGGVNETTVVSPIPASSRPSPGTMVVCGLPGGPACPKR
jgi:hypothetical protein